MSGPHEENLKYAQFNILISLKIQMLSITLPICTAYSEFVLNQNIVTNTHTQKFAVEMQKMRNYSTPSKLVFAP
jgi:uncharacterized protein YlaN (UPF0358 family)